MNHNSYFGGSVHLPYGTLEFALKLTTHFIRQRFLALPEKEDKCLKVHVFVVVFGTKSMQRSAR
jgi:hypothetical protein